MKATVTAGLAVLAGVALFEAALIPGVVIGGAAVLAPKYLPMLRRGLKPLFGSSVRRPPRPKAPPPSRQAVNAPAAAPGGFAIKQAVAKTITFRIIVTTLDFTTNYIVIGELATAAGLSAFALVAGPLFYLAHEMAWNRFGPSSEAGVPVRLPLLSDATAPQTGRGELTISRALAKTITFLNDRHRGGLHRELRGRRRPRHRGGSVGPRLCGRSVCLSRPREAVGLLWFAAGSHPRSTGGTEPAASSALTPTTHSTVRG